MAKYREQQDALNAAYRAKNSDWALAKPAYSPIDNAPIT